MGKIIEIHVHKTYRTSGSYSGHWFREVSWRDENGNWFMSCAPRAKEACAIVRRVKEEFANNGFGVCVTLMAG